MSNGESIMRDDRIESYLSSPSSLPKYTFTFDHVFDQRAT